MKAEDKKGAAGKIIDFSAGSREVLLRKKANSARKRGEKVLRLREDIKKGGYTVNAEKVAEKIIKRSLRKAVESEK